VATFKPRLLIVETSNSSFIIYNLRQNLFAIKYLEGDSKSHESHYEKMSLNRITYWVLVKKMLYFKFGVLPGC
jgi:hypothetical protein